MKENLRISRRLLQWELVLLFKDFGLKQRDRFGVDEVVLIICGH